ncbi:MAG: Fe-S protein assembly co-chaperone HscB [Algisphaera sp.]
MDAFDQLNLPAQFDLDPGTLEAAYLQAAAAHHPDRFTDPLDQADAADRTAAITGAHRALSDPGKRARVLLARHGVSVADGGSPPPALLMEVMEVREALETAMHQQDSAEVERLRQQAQERRDDHLQQLSKHFASDPIDTDTVIGELNALRYMQRMLDQMDTV